MPDLRVDWDDQHVFATLTLTRGHKRNALTREMLRELRAALASVADEPGLRGLFIAAEGPVFCAGMDLGEMQATATDPHAESLWLSDSKLYAEVVSAIWSVPVPTVAAVQGPVVAGGMGLVLACDMVLASTAATFTLPEPQRGITASIVTPLLVQRVGFGAAGHLLLSGQSWDAQTAAQRGVCHQVTPPEELPTAVEAIRASLRTGAPEALKITKAQWRASAGTALPPLLEAAALQSAAARGHAEAREGLQAFLEKRRPNWM